jgi:hypothetical protein
MTAIGGGDEGAIANGAAVGPFRGVFPVAPTSVFESGEIDREGQGRVLDCMADQGVDGLLELAQELQPLALRWGH